MNIQKIFTSGIIFLILGFFLFQITYNGASSTQNAYYELPKVETGLYQKNTTASGEIFQLQSSQEFATGSYYKDILNWTDTIYFAGNNTDSYQKKVENRKVSFDIKDGIFFFDLLDMSFEYFIRHKNFSIEVVSPGKFYVDTNDLNNIKIFSLDGVIEVDLLSPTDQQKMTSIILYPHMKFGVNPGRIRFMKNADLYRMTDLADISYIPGLDVYGENALYSKLYQEDDVKTKDFLQTTLSIFEQSFSKNKQLSDILLPDNISKIPGISWIQQYSFLFYNDEKKKVFLKNLFLSHVNETLIKETIVASDIATAKDILGQIQSLDRKGFDEMREIIYFYYKNVFSYSSQNDGDKIFFLGNILGFMNGSGDIDANLTSAIFLNNIYKNIHNKTLSKANIHSSILEYVNFLFQENNISFDRANSSINVLNNSEIPLEYISFFLRNIILYDTQLTTEQQLQDFTQILHMYYSINNTVSVQKKGLQNENIILEYERVLQNTLREIRSTLFLEELNEQNLLIPNPEISIGEKSLIEAQNMLKKMYDFYQTNQSYLTEKNFPIRRVFERYNTQMNQYFLAVIDNASYINLYDTTKTSLLNTSTVGELNQGNQTLDLDYVEEYFSQFDSVDISNLDVVLQNDEYFEIKNFKIVNSNGPVTLLGFDLYPFRLHTIENISINGEAKNNVYELDTLQKLYASQLENSFGNEEAALKYDFKKFFLTTFGNNQTQETPVIDDFNSNQFEDQVVEDRTIVLFKRDRLLGRNGEFSKLLDYINIPYSALDVSREGDNYNIKINQATLQHVFDRQSATVRFDSDYQFSYTNHYFENISLTFTIRNNDATTPLFFGNPLLIEDKIQNLSFKKDMQKILNGFFASKFIYDSVYAELGITDIKMTYAKEYFTYRFSHKGTSFSVTQKIGETNVIFRGRSYTSEEFVEQLKSL